MKVFFAIVLYSMCSAILFTPAVWAQKETSVANDKYIQRWVRSWNNEERASWQKPAEVLKILAVEPGMQIADIGAGTGYFTEKLSQLAGKSGRVYAVDVNEKFLRYLRESKKKYAHPNVTVVKGGKDKTGLPANAFDRILMVNTWHHIDNPAVYLQSLQAAFKPGGRLVIIDYEKAQPWDKQGKHFYTIKRLREDLKKSGSKFKLELPEESLPRQFVAVLTIPI